MNKVAALDLGNEWTGTALSDLSKTFARPHKTTATQNLDEFLTLLLKAEPIDTIVLGHPRTMRGTASQQTLLVEKAFEELQQKFNTVQWVLWDERLSSKRAEQHKKKEHSKENKLALHSIAAAFILDSYLTFLRAQQEL